MPPAWWLLPLLTRIWNSPRRAIRTACHTVDKKLVGPAYVDVAKKYAGDFKDAAKALAVKVKAGSKGGVWGQIPMPPNPNVKDADMETLIKWILAGAK